ncbi:MAG: 1-acyl-sn-glycerol-3-phosphate acyltransferase [Patescibacteria group bacterium]|nr:1-acyl-sn-glycerol-3-phosphate acyltransferase [Patescibacteria group bacterium]
MYLLRNKISIGIILYLIPLGFNILVFRFASWLIQPAYSVKNGLIAYGIFSLLICISFISGYLVAKRGGVQRWWIKFSFAVIVFIQFLPILLLLAPIGALIIEINNQLSKISSSVKNSKVGCTITSIIAAVSAFSGLLFIVEKGNVKTAKRIGKAVFVATHWGSGDYFVAALLAIFRNWRVMIGANLWKYWIFHWFFNAVGIPIERDETAVRERVKAIIKAKAFLAKIKKAILIVFIQGTRERHPENGVHDSRIGAFKIACDLGVPVVPIVIFNTNKWRKPGEQDTTSYLNGDKKISNIKILFNILHQFFKTGINPTIVKVVYGNPISTIGKTPEQVKVEVEFVMNKIYFQKKSKKRQLSRSQTELS